MGVKTTFMVLPWPVANSRVRDNGSTVLLYPKFEALSQKNVVAPEVELLAMVYVLVLLYESRVCLGEVTSFFGDDYVHGYLIQV